MTIVKHCFSLISVVLFTLGIQGRAQQKNNVNDRPFPYNNPVIAHMYTADPAPHVFPDGRMWMVTSVDHKDGGGFMTMHAYHTFSTADMVNWIDHGEILNIDDVGQPENPKTDWALYAPDMVYRHGKYYLYYPIHSMLRDTLAVDGKHIIENFIGVAVNEKPYGKFKILNPRIEGTDGIDPSIFVDDDDQVYLAWGKHMVSRLKDNMYELATEPVQVDLGTNTFMEASWLEKRDSTYYYSFHTRYNRNLDPQDIDDSTRVKSELAYSVSKDIMGPYTYKGIINKEPGVGVTHGARSPLGDYVPWRLTLSNHVGIAEWHGHNYLFYHTSALSSWRQDEFKERGTWTQRSTCIDRLEIDENGNYQTVIQTLEGVEPIEIDQPFEILLTKNVEVGNSNRVLKFENIDLGTGYYYFGLTAKEIKHPLKVEVRRGASDGQTMGTLYIAQDGTAETYLRHAKGMTDVYLVFSAEGNGVNDLKDIRFFAGSPKEFNGKVVKRFGKRMGLK